MNPLRIMAGRLLTMVLVSVVLNIHSAMADDRPNIVLIFTDDQGISDVGCYGSEIPTPHIDSLAKDGLKCTSWYSASSICTPSRYGLLTGQNPSRSQDQLLGALMFLGEEDAQRGLQPGETTIAEVLHGAGYQTALLGKWHLGHGAKSFLPTQHGFDLFRGHTAGCVDYFTMTYGVLPDWYHGEEHVSINGYATDVITQDAVHFLQNQKSSDKPFFLYLSYNAPHFGKGWSPGAGETVNIMQPQANDLKRVDFIDDKIRREFAAMTVALDDGVGKVLKTIKENGLEEETLVVFLTDHGGDPVYGGNNLPYRGDKATLFEGGLRVPAIFRWPGKIKAGSTTNEVLTSLDLFPTFCKLADVDVTKLRLDGLDLSDVILRQNQIAKRDLFWELGAHKRLDRGAWTSVRSGDWKYLQDADGIEYLFNLQKDPYEKEDLSGQKTDVFLKMKSRRDALVRQYRPQPTLVE
ncbi:MAG: sulfatase-like hydrolase/transferase [Planctomycetaceae bacterium]|jgi:arylsulfatase A-like enzyme|nr:sulfatase-like hydrolase/transferase [Planctomycetaceae bacterium]MDB4786841.1 sulfatase-like hydrolase/transferase [Planctomycetaceae bacterium]MDC0308551.1 sulfatase-like hydrolase/transferase [Planctomycetaceae bacterium]MDG2391412.1 sulfatase-like hydrolase/transferase [Planctomycetaceae bacterium]